MADDTSVRIKTDTWKRLNDLKEPGDSFDDIIRRLLDESDDIQAGNGLDQATAD